MAKDKQVRRGITTTYIDFFLMALSKSGLDRNGLILVLTINTYWHRIRNRTSDYTNTDPFCRPHILDRHFGYHKLYHVLVCTHIPPLLFALHIEVFGFYKILGVAQADIEPYINFIDWISRYISKR